MRLHGDQHYRYIDRAAGTLPQVTAEPFLKSPLNPLYNPQGEVCQKGQVTNGHHGSAFAQEIRRRSIENAGPGHKGIRNQVKAEEDQADTRQREERAGDAATGPIDVATTLRLAERSHQAIAEAKVGKGEHSDNGRHSHPKTIAFVTKIT